MIDRTSVWTALVAGGVLLLATAGGASERPLDDAQRAVESALRLKDEDRYTDAAREAQRAVALREAALPPSDPRVAEALQLLGEIRRRQGDTTTARALVERALTLREAALGPQHPDVAESLYELAVIELYFGAYDRAEPLMRRSLDIALATGGPDHPRTAKARSGLGTVLLEQGRLELAEPELVRALEIRERALPPTHPDLAGSVVNLANLYTMSGRYAEAEKLYPRAVALLESSRGKRHLMVSHALNNHGFLLSALGRYEEAERAHRRALEIREEVHRGPHQEIADALTGIANSQADRGFLVQAEQTQRRALEISMAVLDPKDPQLSMPLHNLAALLREQGRYEGSEELELRALAILEKAFGEEHPDVARSLSGLATLYRAQGASDRATVQLERALRILEKVYPPDHPSVALGLNNLAHLYAESGSNEKARPLYERALAIQERALGPRHHEVAETLRNLADVALEAGRWDAAEGLYRKAERLQRSHFGDAHPELAHTLSSLGTLRMRRGRAAPACRLYRDSLAISEKTVGPEHPLVAQTLWHLSGCEASLGRIDAAVSALERALTLSERRLRREGLELSGQRLDDLLRLLRRDEERAYALATSFPAHAGARRLALSATLLLKGRSARETAHRTDVVRRSLDPGDQERFERLRAVRVRLAAMWQAAPSEAGTAEHRQGVAALIREEEELESSLARHSAQLRTLGSLPTLAEIVGRVAAALPKDGVLVEFARFSGMGHDGKIPAPRYAALLLHPDGQTAVLELGPADTIDASVARLRLALARPEGAYLPHARALHARIVTPVLRAAPGAKELVWSGDGAVTLVPVDVLHDGTAHVLDRLRISYVTSGRELLEERTAGGGNGMVVFADPDFDAEVSAAAKPGPASGPAGTVIAEAGVRGRSAGWASLPGTRKEAARIRELFPEARTHLGAEATKAALMGITSPEVLHIATHGFFLEDDVAGRGGRAAVTLDVTGTRRERALPADPLLRSGLVLSGAARDPAGALVTALELTSVTLSGTRLVVLSACDTGLGEVRTGQGVYGLRRALLVAGAQTVVMSLWKVNDETTSVLMGEYYRRLVQGAPRGEALREAMTMVRRTHRHPHFWGPFIAVGATRPLRPDSSAAR